MLRGCKQASLVLQTSDTYGGEAIKVGPEHFNEPRLVTGSVSPLSAKGDECPPVASKISFVLEET